MNESRYLLPVTFAAAFHAALLLGFTARSPVVTIPPPEKPVMRPFPPELLALLRQEPSEDTTKPVTSARQGDRVPEQVDLPRPPIEKNVFEFPTPDHPWNPNIPVNGSTTGRPDGLGNELWGSPGGEKFIAGREQLDHPPKTKWRAAPEYPLPLRQAGVEGVVVVEFVVDLHGRVAEARIVSSSYREFEAAAIQAVRQWRFESGRRHGRLVAFRLTVPIEFKLDTE